MIDTRVFSRRTPEELAQEAAFKLIGLVDQEPQRMFLRLEKRLLIIYLSLFLLFGNLKMFDFYVFC